MTNSAFLLGLVLVTVPLGVFSLKSMSGASEPSPNSPLGKPADVGAVAAERVSDSALFHRFGSDAAGRPKRRQESFPRMTTPTEGADYRLGMLYSLVAAALLAVQEPFSALAAKSQFLVFHRLHTNCFVVVRPSAYSGTRKPPRFFRLAVRYRKHRQAGHSVCHWNNWTIFV